MYNNSSNPILLNCIFSGNAAPRSGSGMYNSESNPTLTNCTFIGNQGGSGGGMYNFNSRPMLADCAFSRNSTLSGGGMFNENSDPALLNCTFSGNSSLKGNGGGIENISNSNPTLTNCIFSDNSALYGGAINCHDSSPMIINNTIINNSATGYGGGGIYCAVSSLMVVNTILWNNSPDEIYEKRDREIPSTITVTYSNVKGGFPGEGNIDIDPLFADPDNGDYHLKSQAGRWNPISQSWVIDQISSPCIDAGDPGMPAGLERFPNGDRINMGAYGGTPEASLSPQQLPSLLGKASNPYPADQATNVPRNVILSWTPGENSQKFNVYFGTDYDTVEQANTNDSLGVLVSLNQDPNIYSPGLLDYGHTYFWRIDGISAPPESKVTKGHVWTFTTSTPKGRACFTAQTGVWADGTLIPISKIGCGQCVDIVGCTGTVEEVQEHMGSFICYDITLESGNCIQVAECHYFLAESGRWIALQDLKAGTRLQTAKGSIGIISVTRRTMPYVGKVYNLKIEGSDRYLVGKDAVIVRDY
jgi:predicted outer membrane repeat protein